MLAPSSNKKPQVHYLDELWVRKPVRQHIKEFACVMAIVMLLIAGIIAWKQGSLATIAAITFTALVLVLLGYTTPSLLHPVWKAWMKFAMALGLVVSTLILSLGWAILIIPFALGMRAFGKRVMDLSYSPAVQTYWESRDSKLDDFKLLERQY